MPIRYVGREIDHKGKTLFQILCNLRNLGTGRVVIRNMFLRFPEPSYFRITRAEPKMDPENKLGTAWAELIFRGVNFGVRPIYAGYKKDWQLLSKEDELEICKIKILPSPPIRILPATLPFPPLFKDLLLQDRRAKGLSVDPEIQLPMVYYYNDYEPHRLAEPGEVPTEDITIGPSPELYKLQ